MSGHDAQGDLPLVSVVINCYNGERFVRETLESVYAQQWPRWEIVFWDNASTDRTNEIARGFDERLRYFRAERNTPLGEARNLAFAQARGDFIAMLDADDVWLPDTLDRLVAGMRDADYEYTVCYGGVYRIDVDGRETGRFVLPTRRGILLPDLMRNFEILPSASMIRRATLLATGHKFDTALTASEEVCFFLTLAVDHPFHALSECVTRYRIHPGALTNKSIAKWADEWQYAVDQIVAAHPGVEDQYPDGFRHIRARIDYYRARNLMHNGDRRGARVLLRHNIGVDRRYLVLFLIALFPVRLWNMAHKWFHRRAQ